MNRIVLIVAAHSDDEALGCSGAIAKHVSEGDSVHLLFMTDGVSSRVGGSGDTMDRLAMAQIASKVLGVSTLTNLNFPDNQMDSIPLLNIVVEVESKIKELRPEIIYTHHAGDLNVDHQVTYKAVVTACRPQPNSFVKEMYAFEVLSSTEWQTVGSLSFLPNVYIDITEFIDIKERVLNIYSVEMHCPPHSRSVDNILRLNALRGNSVGVEYAEAFKLIRIIR
jgi:N-acetylglucosamine malate deacetylase 1